VAVPATVDGECSPIISTGVLFNSDLGRKGRTLIHKPGDLPSSRLSVGRVNHSEADLRVGDNRRCARRLSIIRQTPHS